MEANDSFLSGKGVEEVHVPRGVTEVGVTGDAWALLHGQAPVPLERAATLRVGQQNGVGRQRVELCHCREEHAHGGLSLDIAGPDVLTYGEIVERIADHMLVDRIPVRLGFGGGQLASRVAAVIAGEDHGLIGPLMEGLTSDLLPRDDRAAQLLGVRLHRFDAAVEHALREWEESEELAAR